MVQVLPLRCCREPGDLSCWAHIQQHKCLQRQRAALRERLHHVIPDAQLAVHLEMDQPVLTAQLRLGEVGLSPSQPESCTCQRLDLGVAHCVQSAASTFEHPLNAPMEAPVSLEEGPASSSSCRDHCAQQPQWCCDLNRRLKSASIALKPCTAIAALLLERTVMCVMPATTIFGVAVQVLPSSVSSVDG